MGFDDVVSNLNVVCGLESNPLMPGVSRCTCVFRKIIYCLQQEKIADIMTHVKSGHWSFTPRNVWATVSDGAKSLVTAMMQVSGPAGLF